MTAGKPQSDRRASRGRRVLRRIELCLWVIGWVALGYCGHAYFSAGFCQLYESWRFDRMIQSGARPGPVGDARPGGGGPSGNHAPSPSERPAPDAGSLIGRIEIPRLGLSAMVRHGDDAGTLTKAVGHLPRTSLPGQPGNVVLAGHRDTFFRKLRDIRKDDTITFTTLNGKFHYAVESIAVVDPDYTQALQPSPYPTLTLVTCYPFTYIGNAPRRFIVRAREVGSEPTLAAESSELAAADSAPVPRVASQRKRAPSRASLRQQPAQADLLSDQPSLSFTDLAFSFDSSSQAQKSSTPLRRLGSFFNKAGKKILFRDRRSNPPES